MGKKKRGHRMPAWRKAARMAANLLLKGVGIGAAAGPAIVAVKDNLSKPGEIGPRALYLYTGVNVETGSVDPSQTIAGIGSVAGGLFLLWLGSALARRI